MAEWHTFTSEGISVYSVEERPGALYLVTHTSMLRNLETKNSTWYYGSLPIPGMCN